MKLSNLPDFSSREEKSLWIEKIVYHYQNGLADSGEVARLRHLLQNDSEARELYFRGNELTMLLESFGKDLAVPQSIPRTSPASRRWWAAGIAATLALGVFFLAQQRPDAASQERWLASLASSHQAIWKTNPTKNGYLYQSNLSLKSGVIEIEFKNGAKFVIEGPAELELIDKDTLFLASGKLWSQCPPSAHGFEVLTPGDHRIVDLGTEFGVEVDSSGETDVHVFDGEVEVIPYGNQKRSLEAGSAVKMDATGNFTDLAASLDGFTSREELQNARWRAHRRNLLKNEDLLLYYDFNHSKKAPRVIKNKAQTIGHGRYQDALQVRGRIHEKRSLLFEQAGAAVKSDLTELDISGGFTTVMWIKPYRFRRSHLALLNSNGYDSGDVHFQLTSGGALNTSIHGIGKYTTGPGAVKAGEWQFVAMRWDLEEGKAQLFVNGKAMKTEWRKEKFLNVNTIANFGECQVGAWAEPTYGHHRNFEGRIGELLIFDRPLEEEKLEELYEVSKP